jgi:hypothetical protein
MRGAFAALTALTTLASRTDAHGSMIMPPSRNSVDADLPPWSHGKFPETGLIEPYTCHCINGTSECSAGQSCLYVHFAPVPAPLDSARKSRLGPRLLWPRSWFSQGCSIFCSKCTGNGTRIPNLDHCPEERAAGFDPLKLAGALHPVYRSINLNAVPGSADDIWKFNPWRAPGLAPVCRRTAPTP